MPRSQVSPLGRVLDYFRTAPLEILREAHGLVNDTVRDRLAKSTAAKARAQRPAAPTPTAVPAAAPKAAKPKAKKKARKLKSQPLPLDAMSEGAK